MPRWNQNDVLEAPRKHLQHLPATARPSEPGPASTGELAPANTSRHDLSQAIDNHNNELNKDDYGKREKNKIKFSIEELNMKSKKCREYKLNIGGVSDNEQYKNKLIGIYCPILENFFKSRLKQGMPGKIFFMTS